MEGLCASGIVVEKVTSRDGSRTVSWVYHSEDLQRWKNGKITGVCIPGEYSNLSPFLIDLQMNGCCFGFVAPFKFPEKNIPKEAYDGLLRLVQKFGTTYNIDQKELYLNSLNELKITPFTLNTRNPPNGKELLEWYDVEETFNLDEVDYNDEITAKDLAYMGVCDPVLKKYVLEKLGITMQKFLKVQKHTVVFKWHLELARHRMGSNDIYEHQAKGYELIDKLPTEYFQVLHELCDPAYVRYIAFNESVLSVEAKRLTENDWKHIRGWRGNAVSRSDPKRHKK